MVISPLKLRSCDRNFPKTFIAKECRTWDEPIKNTKMAKFEVPSIKRVSLYVNLNFGKYRVLI